MTDAGNSSASAVVSRKRPRSTSPLPTTTAMMTTSPTTTTAASTAAAEAAESGGGINGPKSSKVARKSTSDSASVAGGGVGVGVGAGVGAGVGVGVSSDTTPREMSSILASQLRSTSRDERIFALNRLLQTSYEASLPSSSSSSTASNHHTLQHYFPGGKGLHEVMRGMVSICEELVGRCPSYSSPYDVECDDADYDGFPREMLRLDPVDCWYRPPGGEGRNGGRRGGGWIQYCKDDFFRRRYCPRSSGGGGASDGLGSGNDDDESRPADHKFLPVVLMTWRNLSYLASNGRMMAHDLSLLRILVACLFEYHHSGIPNRTTDEMQAAAASSSSYSSSSSSSSSAISSSFFPSSSSFQSSSAASTAAALGGTGSGVGGGGGGSASNSSASSGGGVSTSALVALANLVPHLDVTGHRYLCDRYFLRPSLLDADHRHLLPSSSSSVSYGEAALRRFGFGSFRYAKLLSDPKEADSWKSTTSGGGGSSWGWNPSAILVETRDYLEIVWGIFSGIHHVLVVDRTAPRPNLMAALDLLRELLEHAAAAEAAAQAQAAQAVQTPQKEATMEKANPRSHGSDEDDDDDDDDDDGNESDTMTTTSADVVSIPTLADVLCHVPTSLLHKLADLLYIPRLGPDATDYVNPVSNIVSRVPTLKLLLSYDATVDTDLRDRSLDVLVGLSELDLKRRRHHRRRRMGQPKQGQGREEAAAAGGKKQQEQRGRTSSSSLEPIVVRLGTRRVRSPFAVAARGGTLLSKSPDGGIGESGHRRDRGGGSGRASGMDLGGRSPAASPAAVGAVAVVNTRFWDALVPAWTTKSGRTEAPHLAFALLRCVSGAPENAGGLVYVQERLLAICSNSMRPRREVGDGGPPPSSASGAGFGGGGTMGNLGTGGGSYHHQQQPQSQDQISRLAQVALGYVLTASPAALASGIGCGMKKKGKKKKTTTMTTTAMTSMLT